MRDVDVGTGRLGGTGSGPEAEASPPPLPPVRGASTHGRPQGQRWRRAGVGRQDAQAVKQTATCTGDGHTYGRPRPRWEEAVWGRGHAVRPTVLVPPARGGHEHRGGGPHPSLPDGTCPRGLPSWGVRALNSSQPRMRTADVLRGPEGRAPRAWPAVSPMPRWASVEATRPSSLPTSPACPLPGGPSTPPAHVWGQTPGLQPPTLPKLSGPLSLSCSTQGHSLSRREPVAHESSHLRHQVTRGWH